MNRTVPLSTVEGFRREIKDLRRQVMDLKRDQGWQFDSDEQECCGEGFGASNVVGLGTQDAPDVLDWTAGGGSWVDGDAEWIWHTALVSGSRPADEEGWFVGAFNSPASVAASVEFSADDECEVYLNGTLIGSTAGTPDAYTLRFTALVTLVNGPNVFKVTARNDSAASSNPAAFILSVQSLSGTVLFRTNDQIGWTGYTTEPTGWANSLEASYALDDLTDVATGSPSNGDALTFETASGLWKPAPGGSLPGAWASFTPTWTAATSNPSLGNGTLIGKYIQLGKTIHFRVKLVFGSTTTSGTGAWRFDLPVAPHADYSSNTGLNVGGYAENNGVAGYSIDGARIDSGSTIIVQSPNGGNVYQSGTPFAWGNLDFLSFHGTYEAA